MSALTPLSAASSAARPLNPSSTASEASRPHLDLRPRDGIVLARPQHLHRGLLDREARGQALGVHAGAGPALGQLSVGVDALEVALAVRADGFLHAGYRGQIDSHSDWHTRKGPARTVVRTVRRAGERGVRRTIPCACTRRCRGFPAPDGGRNLRRRERHAILCYHAVSDGLADPSLGSRRRRSSGSSAILLGRGYRGVTFTEAVEDAPRERTMSVTFDDSFRSVIELARPVLRELGAHGVRADLLRGLGAADAGTASPPGSTARTRAS